MKGETYETLLRWIKKKQQQQQEEKPQWLTVHVVFTQIKHSLTFKAATISFSINLSKYTTYVGDSQRFKGKGQFHMNLTDSRNQVYSKIHWFHGSHFWNTSVRAFSKDSIPAFGKRRAFGAIATFRDHIKDCIEGLWPHVLDSPFAGFREDFQ